MGSCSSVICSERNQVKMSEDRIARSHKRRKRVGSQQAAGTTPKVSPSLEIQDIESANDSPSSTLSESDSNMEYVEALEKCGTHWLPSKQVGKSEVRKVGNRKKFVSSPKKEHQLGRDNEPSGSEIGNSSPKEHSSAPPAAVRHFRYTGPPPRPSPWKEVYLTMIKPNEQLVEKSFETITRRGYEKKKQRDTAKEISVLRKQLAQRIDSIKRKSSYVKRRNTPEDEDFCSEPVRAELLSDGSSSKGEPYSCTNSSSFSDGSHSGSVISNDSFKEPSTDRYYNGCDESAVTGGHGDLIRTLKRLHRGKNVVTIHRLFRGRQNKVSPM